MISKLTALFLVAALILPAMLSASTIHVPADQSTIQAGINAAANGDTVLVAPGTYFGAGNRDIDFGGKLIVVKSESGWANTVIDCQGDAINKNGGFDFHSGEDSTAVVDGFTIIHSFADRAAVRCSTAAPAIRNCVISDNHYGGLRCYNGFGLTVQNCTFSQNDFCGMELNFCRAHISDCTIDSNAQYGILAVNNAAFDLSRSLILDNGDRGVSIWVFTTKFRIMNCTFTGNSIGLYYDGDFPKNGVQEVAEQPLDTSQVRNNIFAFNRQTGCQLGQMASYCQASCNDWYGNPGGDFLSNSGVPFDTAGNISANPLFCDTAAGNFGIANLSFCAPANSPCAALIGLYPVSCTLNVTCGDVDASGGVDVSDAVYLVRHIFAGGPAPMPLPVGDVNCDNGIDISDAVYLIYYIFAGGPAPCANCP